MQKEAATNIDLTYLYLVTMGDRQFEKMLLEGAVTDIQNQVDNLQKAWHQQNAIVISNTVHSLKSVSAIAGLLQLESYCKIIDNLFADGIFHNEAEATCYDIINEWQSARPQLEGLIVAY